MEITKFPTARQDARYKKLIQGLRPSTVNDTYSDRYGIHNIIGTPYCFCGESDDIKYSSNLDDFFENWLNCLEWASSYELAEEIFNG